jgi:hypothetical protein
MFMNIILLAGNSIHNKQWIYEVEAKLGPLFEQSYIQDYSHWANGKENIDFTLESEKLSAKVSNLVTYVIFAKSVGTILALEGIYKRILRPAKCIFVGVPLKGIHQAAIPFNDWLEHTDVPILFIQNSNDPVGAYGELKDYIKPAVRFTMTESVGNSHNYDDLDTIKKLVADFI